jgi:nucleotide-binding universal stress UspA family protein
MKKSDQLIPKPPVEALSIKQALVGIEFDETDITVLQYVDFFSKQVPVSAAYFMHVLPPVDWMSAMMERESVSFEEHYAVSDEVITYMEKQVKENISEREKFYVEYDVRTGDPLSEMLKSAEELGVDLLIVGQSNTKTSHNILGKNLARKTKANALIIPEGATKSISNILVPIDFSENSGRALEAAASLSKSLKNRPKITCLYVYRIPSLKHFKADAPWIQTVSTVEDNIRKAFEDFVFEYTPEYQDNIEFELLEKTTDSIANNIKAYTKENTVDFLVLGAKGHSKVHLLFLGSVTEELLDINEDIPAMIVR